MALTTSLLIIKRDEERIPMNQCGRSDYARRLREHKQQLVKLAEDSDVGYLRDVLMLHAFLVRSADMNQLRGETQINAEERFRQPFDYDLYNKFYSVYSEDCNGEFYIYPDQDFQTAESLAVLRAGNLRFWKCGIEHGGYRLYQGTSLEILRADLAGVGDSWLANSPKSLKIALYEADTVCMHRRIKSGSAFSLFAGWLQSWHNYIFNLDAVHSLNKYGIKAEMFILF